MIMESNAKWEKGQNFISEGMKQMNPLTSKSQDNWAWDMLKRLHLHVFDRHAYSSHDQLQQILMVNNYNSDTSNNQFAYVFLCNFYSRAWLLLIAIQNSNVSEKE